MAEKTSNTGVDNENLDKASDADLSDDEILRVMRERFDLAANATDHIRKEAIDDMNFTAGEQWPEDVKRERSSDGRPCLVINRTSQFVQQVTNDQRQNNSAIKVFPVDDKATKPVAEVMQGMIRHIEYNSNADAAYDTAFEGAVRNSFGFWRIITQYTDPMSFKQEILIKQIRNHCSVLLDPNHKESDGSDTDYAFCYDDLSVEDYKAKFKDSDLCNSDMWNTLASRAPDWINEKTIRVTEYFYKEYEEVEIVLMADGQVFEKSKLPKDLPDGEEIADKRTTQVAKIKWIKTNGVEILEKTDWLGQWIPIVPVYGNILDINGKLILESVIRHAKDSQRMYNYWASSETESIALAPKAPFIAAEGQIPPEYKNDWQTANKKNHAFLTYKPTSVNGTPLPAPTRNSFEPAVQAITNARMQASEDMKATTGIYDASLGNQSNEVSGIAIQRRNNQAQTSNFHFVDNLSRSKRHTGRILVDLIPKIYDTEQAIRIVKEDGEQEITQINTLFSKDGKQVQYLLGIGKYDVIIDDGPNFATKRQEAAASMLDVAKTNPAVMQVAGDLMVRNMDWPGKDEIADRLHSMLPPQLQNQDKNQPPLPPQIQNQMGQMKQQIQMLSQQLQAANQLLSSKVLDLQSKERIAFSQQQTDLTVKKMDIDSGRADAQYQQEMAHVERFLDYAMPQTQPTNLNGSGPQPAANPNAQQQPTGGQTPGNSMGGNP